MRYLSFIFATIMLATSSVNAYTVWGIGQDVTLASPLFAVSGITFDLGARGLD